MFICLFLFFFFYISYDHVNFDWSIFKIWNYFKYIKYKKKNRLFTYLNAKLYNKYKEKNLPIFF